MYIYTHLGQKSFILLQELFPSRRLQSEGREQLLAVLQAATIVVSRILNKEVVFKHLFRKRCRHEAFICLQVDLHEPTLLSNNDFELR